MSWSAERIKELRLGLGWSAADFSRRLGTTSEAVMNWEAGQSKPTTDDLRQIERLSFYLESYSSVLERQSTSESVLALNNFEQIHRNDLLTFMK